MAKVKLKKFIPRGRKRQRWKKEFLKTLNKAAEEIGEVSEEQISAAVRDYRRERRVPEITVAEKS